MPLSANPERRESKQEAAHLILFLPAEAREVVCCTIDLLPPADQYFPLAKSILYNSVCIEMSVRYSTNRCELGKKSKALDFLSFFPYHPIAKASVLAKLFTDRCQRIIFVNL